MRAALALGNLKRVVQVLGFALGALLFCLPASAQLNYGHIYGSVTDQTGGSVAGATVTVTDADRGIARPLTTDESGAFSASSLLPGNYTVRAEAAGFKASDHQGLTLAVGQDLRVDFTLQPGEQNQTVTITGDVPQVNTTSATLGGTVETSAIVDLPLNGRAFQKLLDYSPGMQQVPGGGTPAYNVNGQRGTNIAWMLDGIDEINMAGGAGPTVGGNGGGVDGVTILSLDAIQEINLIQSPKAEYGWMAGSAVNVGLKSGTNAIHGTAFAFGRDSALDARNAFITPSLGKAEDTLTQYGATIGGAIKKDKLFYFLAYEGNNYTLGAVKTVTEPTDKSIGSTTNSIPDAIAAINAFNADPSHPNAIPLSNMSLLMAGCSTAANNTSLTTGASVAALCGPGAAGAPPSLFQNNGTTATYATAFNNVGGSNNGLVKGDYHLNDKMTLNGEYFVGNGNVNNAVASVSPYWLADNHFLTSTGRAVWVWTPKSSLVNEMRFGVLEYNQLGSPDDCNGHDGAPNYATTYGYNLGVTIPAPQCGLANISFGATFTSLGSQSTNGGPQDNHFSVWSGIDSVSWTRGQHLFKFGGEIHDTRFSGSKSLTNDNGTFAFKAQTLGAAPNTLSGTALEAFLAGSLSTTPNSSSILLGNATLTSPLAYNRYALFAQDDWRIKPRITLNLGVRWEYVAPPTTSNNVLGNFDVNSSTGLVQETGAKPVYNLPKTLFSPRLGVAWDVTGKGTTVIRAGGTYMYDFLVFQQILPNLQNVPTGFKLFAPNGTSVTPGTNLLGTLAPAASAINWTGVGPILNVSTSGFACGNGVAPNPGPCNLNPAVIQANGFRPDAVTAWNLSVQHAFNNNLSLNVAYVGTHGGDLRGTTDINAPTLGATGSANELSRRPFTSNCAASQGGAQAAQIGPCFPYLGQVQVLFPNEISNYNGMQLTLTERPSHGLQFTLGYTLSHALDESSGLSNAANTNLENTQAPGLDYGNAAFDARHHLTLTATYDIPGIKAPAQLLQGWQVNGTLTVLSALPWNAYDATDDLSGTGINQDRWNIFGNPGNFKAGTAGQITCYSLSSGKFASSSNCITVASVANTNLGTAANVANFPAPCVNAAAGGPVNSSLASTVNPYAELALLGCYVQNGTAISPAGQGTYGDMARNVLRGQPFKETDLSITKSWKFRERLTAQYRAEFFNIFNAVQYATPYLTTNSNLASPANFGRSLNTPNTFSFIFGSGGPRTMQMALKLIF